MTSIDEKIKVVLGNLPQKIHIVSNDDTLPILLFLHGGPGVVNRHSIMQNHLDLLDTFTIVTWDQRGSGGSFKGARQDTLTVSQMTDDAAELVQYLCKRFMKDKILIIGGSWGSVLGTFLVYRYPDNIAAFVGFGQVVDGTKNEEISYTFALDAATAAGDEKSIKLLKSVGPPKKGIYTGGLKGLMKQRKVMMKYGGYSPDSKKDSLFKSFVIPVLLSGEYSISDIIGLIKGYRFVLSAMWPEVAGMDLAAECGKFTVPYFILDGRLDYNTPASLVEEYFETIEAPNKELIWFESSGHNPMNDEPELFKNTLRSRLLAVIEAERKKGISI